MDTQDPVVQKTELVIAALAYANIHKLDIKSKENVKQIAEALDPDHTSEEDVEELMRLLEGAESFIKTDVARRKSLN